MGQKKGKEKRQANVVHMGQRKAQQEQPVIVLTNREVNEFLTSDALTALVQSKELRPRAAFRLITLINKLNEIQAVYEKARRALIDTYAMKDKKGEYVLTDANLPDGKIVKKAEHDFTDANRKIFNEELGLVWKKESSIPGKKTVINVADLPTGLLTTLDMIFLGKIIEFEE